MDMKARKLEAEILLSPDIIETLRLTSCIDMQISINSYMERRIGCVTFFLWLPRDNNEVILQVIGKDALINELFFPIPYEGKNYKSFTFDGGNKLDNDLMPLLEEQMSPKPRNIAKFLICHPENPNDVALVFCAVDHKENSRQTSFFQAFFRVVGCPLLTTLHLRTERRLREQTQTLLEVAKDLSMIQCAGSLSDIIRRARLLIGAEFGCVLLVAENKTELKLKVADGDQSPMDQKNEVIPISSSLAGHVALTGKTLNVSDPYSHPLFFRAADEGQGLITKNILLCAIRDTRERVVGVCLLRNKTNGSSFTKHDEEAIEVLANYCGVNLMRSMVYSRIEESYFRVQLANELVMHHNGVTDELLTEEREATIKLRKPMGELVLLSKPAVTIRKEFTYRPSPVATDVLCSQITRCPKHHDIEAMMDSRFPCRDMKPDEVPCLVMAMFEHSGLTATCLINRSTLARFILCVRKRYRDCPYHNWMHAFSVAHFAFYVMQRMSLVGNSYLTDLEAAALLTSALCHDMDHRANTNVFLMKIKSTLAVLYNSEDEGSILERHHFTQTLCVLNIDGCNIFENLVSSDYKRILELIRRDILATDLTTHFARMPKIVQVSNNFDADSREHRYILQSLMMTSADLSDQIKGWQYSRAIAKQICEEFFTQGDIEIAMGYEVPVMLDRNRADIPELQVQFITAVCLPSYVHLARFFPGLQHLVQDVEDNIKRWKAARDWFALPKNEGKSGFALLNDPELEKYVFSE